MAEFQLSALRTPQSEDFSLSQILGGPDSSRAIAGALRALQAELDQCKAENEQLKHQLRQCPADSRAHSARGTDSHTMPDVMKTLNDKLKLKEQHITHLERTLKRSAQLAALNKEKSSLQLQTVQAQLREKEARIAELEQQHKQVVTELALVKEELRLSEQVKTTYFKELEGIRKLSNEQAERLQHSYKEIESAYTAETGELVNTIKSLQKKNRSLVELNRSHTAQIKQLSVMQHSELRGRIGAEQCGLTSMQHQYKRLKSKSKAEASDLLDVKKQLRGLAKTIQAKSRTLALLKKPK